MNVQGNFYLSPVNNSSGQLFLLNVKKGLDFEEKSLGIKGGPKTNHSVGQHLATGILLFLSRTCSAWVNAVHSILTERDISSRLSADIYNAFPT